MMSYNNLNAWKTLNKDTTEFCIRLRTNIHRSKESLIYLKKCEHLKILPAFSKISKSVIEKGAILPKKVQELRTKKFKNAITFHQSRIRKNELKLAKKMAEIKNQVNSNRIFNKIVNFHETLVKNSEQKRDI